MIRIQLRGTDDEIGQDYTGGDLSLAWKSVLIARIFEERGAPFIENCTPTIWTRRGKPLAQRRIRLHRASGVRFKIDDDEVFLVVDAPQGVAARRGVKWVLAGSIAVLLLGSIARCPSESEASAAQVVTTDPGQVMRELRERTRAWASAGLLPDRVADLLREANLAEAMGELDAARDRYERILRLLYQTPAPSNLPRAANHSFVDLVAASNVDLGELSAGLPENDRKVAAVFVQLVRGRLALLRSLRNQR